LIGVCGWSGSDCCVHRPRWNLYVAVLTRRARGADKVMARNFWLVVANFEFRRMKSRSRGLGPSWYISENFLKMIVSLSSRPC
jgi:hypothetical protein